MYCLEMQSQGAEGVKKSVVLAVKHIWKCIYVPQIQCSSLLVSFFHTFYSLSLDLSPLCIFYIKRLSMFSTASARLNHKWESHVFSTHTSQSLRLLNMAVASFDHMLTFSHVHFI